MEAFEAVPVATAPRTHHGEGPVWDAAAGRLWWTDVLAGVVHRGRVEDGTVRHERAFAVGGTVGAILPAAAGGAVLLSDDGYAHLADDGAVTRLLDLPSEQRGVTRMNDGGCDPRGRLWAGTMAFDAAPGRGNLYRTDLEGTTRLVLAGTSISNGIGWSDDGMTMLFVDSGPATIWAFDMDPASGSISGRRPLVVCSEGAVPDGLAMDDEGCAWVAMWGGAEVRRYSPDGALLASVQLPTEQPSSIAFAGERRDLLVVTTSREGLDAAALDAQPGAGLLHVAHVGVTGPAATPFGGVLDGWSIAAA